MLRPLLFIVLFSLSLISAGEANGQVRSASNSEHASSSRPKFRHLVVVEVERDKSDVLSIGMSFMGEAIEGTAEISVQFLSVRRSLDGKLEDVANVGNLSKIVMPAMKAKASSQDAASARPSMTLPVPNGAEALNLSVKVVASGTVKQVFFRVPPRGGTTTGEVRF